MSEMKRTTQTTSLGAQPDFIGPLREKTLRHSSERSWYLSEVIDEIFRADRPERKQAVS